MDFDFDLDTSTGSVDEVESEEPTTTTSKVVERYDELSDFIHESVFPKLDQDERNYLAQWFTTIFSDGFESGDFTAWTGTFGTPEVLDTKKHSGTYACKCNGNEYAYITFDAQTELNARCWYLIESIPDPGEFYHILRLKDSTILLQIYNSGGTLQLRIIHPGGTLTYNYSFETETWYCLELGFVKDAVAGEYKGYIDEVEVISSTGLDTSSVTSPTRVDAGQPFSTSGLTSWIDDVVIADVYIGCGYTTTTTTTTTTPTGTTGG